MASQKKMLKTVFHFSCYVFCFSCNFVLLSSDDTNWLDASHIIL